MRDRRLMDRVSVFGGMAVVALGAVLLLDSAGVVDLGFGWIVPAVIAVAGVLLIAAGLGGPRQP